MPIHEHGWQAAECLVPGLTQAAAEALGRRVIDELAGLPRPGVAFLGSLLMPEDEVLLCLFQGPQAGVRTVSEQAGLPFERIVAWVPLGWQAGRYDGAPGDATALGHDSQVNAKGLQTCWKKRALPVTARPPGGFAGLLPVWC